MNVLIVAPFFFERHRWMMSAYRTALELSREHDVVVLTTGQPRFEQLNARLRVFRLFDLFLPDPINYSIVPNLWYRVVQLVRREQPDVFLVNKFMFFTSFAVPLLRLIGKRVILVTDTFPGMNWQPRYKSVGLVMKLYARVIGVPLLKLATKVVLLHEGLIPVAQRLRLRYQVVHNGIDPVPFDRAAPAADIPRDNDRVNVGYVGRLESVKGYDDLVAVAERMTKQDARLHFYFVGHIGKQRAFVEHHRSPHIHFLGHRDDVPSIYRQLDVFVLPSYSEGLPNALMEAMYSRVACVASRVGGVQVLLKDGESGLFFTPGMHHELQAAIARLAGDANLRRQFGERARATIVQGFLWPTIRKQYNVLFQEMTA